MSDAVLCFLKLFVCSSVMYILKSTSTGSLCCYVLRLQSLVMMHLVLCDADRFPAKLSSRCIDAFGATTILRDLAYMGSVKLSEFGKPNGTASELL